MYLHLFTPNHTYSFKELNAEIVLNEYWISKDLEGMFKVRYYPVFFLTQLKSPKVQTKQTRNLVIRLYFMPITPSLQAQDVNSHTSALDKYSLYVLWIVSAGYCRVFRLM